MRIAFEPGAWQEYCSWADDRKTQRRIEQLIQVARRTPYEGIGNPEALKHELSGCWSRRIDREHRLVYRVTEDGDLQIIQCRHHY